MPNNRYPQYLFIVISLVVLVTCCRQLPSKPSSLDRIRESGHIVMITQNTLNTYYIYREQPKGFEYELASAFAEHLGVDLAVVTPEWIEMFDLLDRGKGDFIAAGVTIVPSFEERLDFSEPYLTVRQEIVVHHDNLDIKDTADLKGQTVHVGVGTSYQEQLARLLGKGLEMELILLPNVAAEDLIEKVADREIEITVAGSNIVRLSRMHQPDVRSAFTFSPPQSLAWAVRKGDSDLLHAINEFLTGIRMDGTLDEIYQRYYEDRNNLGIFDFRAFHELIELRMPRYRPIIKEAAGEHGFDWRLIVAMIYQESLFDPSAISYTGVKGLMQVTQKTADEMGIDDREDPEQSIRAGVAYLAGLYDRFDDITDNEERMALALASYNVGYGHVRDAQGILIKRGHDPDSWSSLREALPLLGIPEIYRNTKFGYARGKEPVRYVENVLTYYEILKRKI